MDAKTLPDLIPPEKQDELHEFQTAVELARKQFFQFIAPGVPGSFQLSPYSLKLDEILAESRRQKIANQKIQDMLIKGKRTRSEQRSTEVSPVPIEKLSLFTRVPVQDNVPRSCNARMTSTK
ncbi:MAG: DNA polymerase zeta [Watsoniomyces obsoletus]|nr:MAG: DNA polymerase zeta [Watsoniomyces obsoletus]